MSGEGNKEVANDVFERPRYLLGFSEHAQKGLSSRVSQWLEASGLSVDSEGLAEDGQQFLIVSAGREELESKAESLGYLKAHKSLQPHVQGQDLGKIEFERGKGKWREGYKDYAMANFWLPCETAQLLGGLVESVPIPQDNSLAPELRHLSKAQAEATLRVAGSLFAALRVGGLLESSAPMHGNREERLAIWQSSKFSALAPTDAICNYFGSQVAMYFAWMNSFTKWLLLPAGAGIVCSLHMRSRGFTVNDDPLLPFYSFFVVLWGVVFVCSWERECAEHAWTWNVIFEQRREQVRSEFRGELRKSAVTGGMECHCSPWQMFGAHCLSVIVTGGMLCVAFLIMVCSLNLQGYMEEHVTSLERIFYIPVLAKFAEPGRLFDPDQTAYFGLLAYVPALLHTLVIAQLNKFYRNISKWLTDNENHRLEEDHENSLILKRFFFEAFDCYIALFYVGFVQQDMQKLRSELSQLYTMDSLRRALSETIIPFATKARARHRSRELYAELKKTDRAHDAEALDQLGQPEYEQFDDFLEMVVEFGYITLFASAFPLASLLSVLCNLVEIKSDLFKLTRIYKRPTAARAATLGTWLRVLQALVFLSILTNVMLFAMSEQLASWAPSLYREATEKDVKRGLVAHAVDADGTSDLVMRKGRAKYVILIATCLEHIVGFLAFLMAWNIPKQPEWVSNEVARLEFYKEEQAKTLRSSTAEAPQSTHVDNSISMLSS